MVWGVLTYSSQGKGEVVAFGPSHNQEGGAMPSRSLCFVAEYIPHLGVLLLSVYQVTQKLLVSNGT